MNILYFTAGAAGMYCGSCLRDNALATELIKQGHQVTLLPLYTPTLTDEPNVSDGRVFFGGISVFLEQHSAIFRHTPQWLDRIWDSKFALRMASKGSISVDPKALGELTVSTLKGESGPHRKEVVKLLDWLKTQPKPDVIDLQNSMLSALAGPLKAATGRPVCCTLQGEDYFLASLPEPYRSEALALIGENARHIDAFIAVSDFYADFMAEFLGIPRRRIHVVPLGINLKDYPGQPQNGHSDVFRIGYFARVAPEKGLHLLAEAYRILRRRENFGPARLEAAGYLAADHKPYLQEIEREMKEAGLADEFRYHGVLDRDAKLQFFRNLDVLSLPSTFADTKGLSVFEAMASGVPVVQPRWGAFPEVVDRTRGGILCEPNDGASLAEALHSLWKNPELMRDLGRQGAERVREHYSVERMADLVLAVYGSLQK
ncbi:MAG TPA: glycosyltransferase family 4 protein [Blastocatellia bacterium]|nr:glycosyltransferase family 4 protein [Blastocatellia bacterium]